MCDIPHLLSVNAFQTQYQQCSIICLFAIVVLSAANAEKNNSIKELVVWYGAIWHGERNKVNQPANATEWYTAKQSNIKQSIICTFNRLLPCTYIWRLSMCVCLCLAQNLLLSFLCAHFYVCISLYSVCVVNVVFPFVGRSLSRFCITILYPLSHYDLTVVVVAIIIIATLIRHSCIAAGNSSSSAMAILLCAK